MRYGYSVGESTQFLSIWNNFQDTLPYVRLNLNLILHDAFINMFTLNPDIKAKFFTFKDYSIQDLKIQEGRKYINVECYSD